MGILARFQAHLYHGEVPMSDYCPKCCGIGYRLRTDENGVWWSSACDCTKGKVLSRGDEKLRLQADRDAQRRRQDWEDEWDDLTAGGEVGELPQ